MKPTILIILDGLGIEKSGKSLVLKQYMPSLMQWFEQYPHALLKASGNAVGLPDNYMGNSEVGHLTIGSGRIIKQPVTQFHELIASGAFFSLPTLMHCLESIKNNNHTIHLMGLLSDAGVHSNQELLYAFIQSLVDKGIKQFVVHPFLDGRDTPPQSAYHYLEKLENRLHEIGYGKIGSVHGRFYAMDRDLNWQRTEKSYIALCKQEKKAFNSWQHILEHYYEKGITDEFIPPTQIKPVHTIHPRDGIIFFNIREDRSRQLTACFVDPLFNHFSVEKPFPLSFFITPIPFSDTLKTNILLPLIPLHNTLKDVLYQQKKTVMCLAETEKYAPVTYFFNGHSENQLPNEERIIIPSLRNKLYNEHPEMKCLELTEALCRSLNSDPKDFYLINYANADMVAHTGDIAATHKAMNILDQALQKIIALAVNKLGGTVYITADHGNAEAINQKNHRMHTTNPVPFIMINASNGNNGKLPLYQLADVAPFILSNLGLPIPSEMIH